MTKVTADHNSRDSAEAANMMQESDEDLDMAVEAMMWKRVAKKMPPAVDAEAARARWERKKALAEAMREAAEGGDSISPQATS